MAANGIRGAKRRGTSRLVQRLNSLNSERTQEPELSVLAIGARSEIKEAALRKVFYDPTAHYLRYLAYLDPPSRSHIVDCDPIRCMDSNWLAAEKHHEKAGPFEVEDVHGGSRFSRCMRSSAGLSLGRNEKY